MTQTQIQTFPEFLERCLYRAGAWMSQTCWRLGTQTEFSATWKSQAGVEGQVLECGWALNKSMHNMRSGGSFILLLMNAGDDCEKPPRVLMVSRIQWGVRVCREKMQKKLKRATLWPPRYNISITTSLTLFTKFFFMRNLKMLPTIQGDI